MDTYVYDVQGMGTGKVETFKSQVIRLHEALQFTQWSKEQWVIGSQEHLIVEMMEAVFTV